MSFLHRHNDTPLHNPQPHGDTHNLRVTSPYGRTCRRHRERGANSLRLPQKLQPVMMQRLLVRQVADTGPDSFAGRVAKHTSLLAITTRKWILNHT
eukprot:52829-Eustigmatos_ZCMA.PRE.1